MTFLNFGEALENAKKAKDNKFMLRYPWIVDKTVNNIINLHNTEHYSIDLNGITYWHYQNNKNNYYGCPSGYNSRDILAEDWINIKDFNFEKS